MAPEPCGDQACRLTVAWRNSLTTSRPTPGSPFMPRDFYELAEQLRSQTLASGLVGDQACNFRVIPVAQLNYPADSQKAVMTGDRLTLVHYQSNLATIVHETETG